LADFQKHYARPSSEENIWENNALLDVVKKVKPTILIGCSTVGGAFTEEIVRAMAKETEQPIIFPLSNPNENCEANAIDLIKWSDGKALIATGSPYEPVIYKDKTYYITQCNNALSFPGIGIGTIACKAKVVTDNMLWAAALAISEQSPALSDPTQPLLPLITSMTNLATHVAIAVAKQAIADGVATKTPQLELEDFIQENIWRPYYRPIKLMK
jgi:malate dehydrogenase (oxaloacetate-decarboxylating)